MPLLWAVLLSACAKAYETSFNRAFRAALGVLGRPPPTGRMEQQSFHTQHIYINRLFLAMPGNFEIPHFGNRPDMWYFTLPRRRGGTPRGHGTPSRRAPSCELRENMYELMELEKRHEQIL
jgi:hypothetical protein